MHDTVWRAGGGTNIPDISPVFICLRVYDPVHMHELSLVQQFAGSLDNTGDHECGASPHQAGLGGHV